MFNRWNLADTWSTQASKEKLSPSVAHQCCYGRAEPQLVALTARFAVVVLAARISGTSASQTPPEDAHPRWGERHFAVGSG